MTARNTLCLVTFALASLLAGCEEKKEAAPAAALAAEARRAAEAQLSHAAGRPVELRGVQVYSQAQPGTAAVCGQVNLQGNGTTSAFTLFVSVVTQQEGRDGGAGTLSVEQHVATSGSTATRVFLETILRCYEEGGPPAIQRLGAPPPMPPVPDSFPNAAASPAPPTPAPSLAPVPPAGFAAPAPDAAPAQLAAPRPTGARATMRQNGNLRAHPNGGGTVLRVVERGTSLDVFAEAPGGWVQVGEGEPWGWMHGSMLAR